MLHIRARTLANHKLNRERQLEESAGTTTPNWRSDMWDAVKEYDLGALEDLLSMERVQIELRRGQIWRNEEAPLHLAAYCGYNDIIKVKHKNNTSL